MTAWTDSEALALWLHAKTCPLPHLRSWVKRQQRLWRFDDTTRDAAFFSTAEDQEKWFAAYGQRRQEVLAAYPGVMARLTGVPPELAETIEKVLEAELTHHPPVVTPEAFLALCAYLHDLPIPFCLSDNPTTSPTLGDLQWVFTAVQVMKTEALKFDAVRRVIDFLHEVGTDTRIPLTRRQQAEEVLRALYGLLMPPQPKALRHFEGTRGAILKRLCMLHMYEEAYAKIKKIVGGRWNNRATVLTHLRAAFPEVPEDRLRRWHQPAQWAQYAHEYVAFHFATPPSVVKKVLTHARKDKAVLDTWH